MKTAESKSSVTASKSKPFFAKESDASLQTAETERAYFPASKKRNAALQAKLSVGRPDDHYEKEADSVADKVVHRLSEPSPGIQPKSAAPAETITPLVQNKSNMPVAEEKLDKKEEERPEKEEKIQKKPIFESRTDAPDDDKNVRRKANDEKEDSLQAKPESSSSAQASPAIESSLNSSKGSGEPLPSNTKKDMESSIGSDFSNVRIHNDSKAAQLSKDLNAQAFTHGNDIYFNSGRYDTGSTEGKHLLAHELTHTIQQGHNGNPSVQRQADDVLTGGVAGNKSTVNIPQKTIQIEKLFLPELKKRNSTKIGTTVTRKKGKYDRKAAYGKGESEAKPQLDLWKDTVKSAIQTPVDNLVAKATAGGANAKENINGLDVFYLKLETKGKGDKIERTTNIMGSKPTILPNVLVPLWDKKGRATAFDADHIRELQLGGENKMDNLELLNFRVNRSSGTTIKNVINRLINEAVTPEASKEKKDNNQGPEPADEKKKMPSVKDAKEKYEITFGEVVYSDKETNFDKGSSEDDCWSRTDIETGEHLKLFTAMLPEEIAKAKGDKEDPVIYTSEVGGKAIRKDDFKAMPGIKEVDFSLPGGTAPGTVNLVIKLPAPMNKDLSVPVPISKMEAVIFGGSMPRIKKGGGGLEKLVSKLDVPGLSPATVDSADIIPKKGLAIRGSIQTTLEILEGVDLEFFIEGDEFGITATIGADDIKVPSPFTINGAFLTIGASNKGVFVEGSVFFEIKGLGRGNIKGKGKSDGNFGISGSFDFDKKLFKNGASISAEYDNLTGWTIKGKLGLGDSVKGIKKGEINVEYKDKILTAVGTAETTIKGVKSVELSVKFGPEIAEIEGKITLDKLPGIKGGSGNLKIQKKGDEYEFSGSGKITPDIPGISSELDFSFEKDIFNVKALIQYENGRLKGKIEVGITNSPPDGGEKPAGKSDMPFRVYGGGDLELKLTPTITVTAGVKLLENGEIEVKGGIKLPPRIEVVPKLFSVTNKPIIEIPEISFPLFGIPLGVTTLGLEATIAPYIKADAQIGPGYLANTQAEVTYNPSHPEELTVTGGADFEFIAEASLHAGVDFGVGISIGIAAAKGGINLDAYIKVAAQQPIFHADIKYSPATGFELNGNVKAIVAAILGFSGKLFLELRAGVWPLKKTWRWDKELFKKEIDTGLQIGFEFPFSYKNGQANVSFDNMKFVYPKFDRSFLNTLSDKLIKPVVDSLL